MQNSYKKLEVEHKQSKDALAARSQLSGIEETKESAPHFETQQLATKQDKKGSPRSQRSEGIRVSQQDVDADFFENKSYVPRMQVVGRKDSLHNRMQSSNEN